MKKIPIIVFSLFFIVSGLFGQYSETFPIPNKGILSGPCTGTDGTTCFSNDFAGVNWTIEGDLSGIDAEPFATNGSGQLSVTDIDEEACWVSPVLNITGASASFELDLTWQSFEDYNESSAGSQDYIDVEYRVDGGDWIQLDNAVGGGPRTVSYVGSSGVDGSLTDFGAGDITGTTLQIRVCIDHNSSAETTTLSNISATGAELPGTAPTCDLELGTVMATDENCIGATDGTLTITTTTTNGPVIYSITGPVNRTNSNGLFTNLPPGSYSITADDAAFVPGTCAVTATATIGMGVDDTPPTASEPAPITVTCLSEVPDPDPAVITDASDDCTVLCATEPWINEFHYDNDGSDAGEFVEIAGPAGLDLSNYTLHLYDGSDNLEEQVFTLSGIIDDEVNGFGALTFATTGLQNQTEGLALVKNGTTVVEFLSYEGSFIALDGPAAGLMSMDVGVEEPANQAVDESLSRIGSGNDGQEFTFVDQTASPGSLNGGQTLLPCPEKLSTVAFLEQTDNGGIGSESDPLIISQVYRITDAAGNFSDIIHTINVIDTEAPAATCEATISLTVDSTGMAVLTPELLDMGSSDNCGGPLMLSIDRDTLTCDDRGEQLVTLLVMDEAGLMNTCSTVVTVMGDDELCAMVPAYDPRYSHDVAYLPISPNPANESVTLDLSGLEQHPGNLKLLMFNALGQPVHEETLSRYRGSGYRLHTTDFAVGLYYLEIRGHKGTIALNRLVINH